MSKKGYRMLFLILTLLFSFGIPIAVIIIKFDILKNVMAMPTKVKVGILSSMAILILTISLFKKIKKMFSKMEFSTFKVIVRGLFNLIFMFALLIVVYSISVIIKDVVYIMDWVVGCNIPALLIFEPMFEKFNEDVKREIRISEISQGVGRAK